jgi:hypothetical protein
LKVYLTHETERLNLEHAYLLKDVFLDKIGRMAPNLREISLRRLRITIRAFTDLVTQLSAWRSWTSATALALVKAA